MALAGATNNKPVLGFISRIGKSRALALPGFHAFLGFDVIFYLLERKKLCFELWLKYFEFTYAYTALSQKNPQKDDIYIVFPILNKFVAHLFQSTDEYQTGESLGFHLFVHKGKSFVNMPSGSDTLMLHSLRSGNQGGYSPQSRHHPQVDGVILHFLRDSTHIMHLLIPFPARYGF